MIKGKKDSQSNTRVYRILPDFNSGCNKCALFNNQAIGGHSFGKINEVELIIIAAYPAMEEVKKGYSLAPNTKKENIDKLNAGRYIEYSVLQTFDLDPNVPNELKIAFHLLLSASTSTGSTSQYNILLSTSNCNLATFSEDRVLLDFAFLC